MLLFEGTYIDVGLVDHTNKFIDAMKNWQKYDYTHLDDDAKKYDEKRKDVERMIQNKLRSLKRVTAIVIKPEYLEYRNKQSPIEFIELGLKVGHLGYPHINMKKEVLSIVEYQEGEFYGAKKEEGTDIRWLDGERTRIAIYLRTINTRPLKLMEWFQKLANKSFW